MRRAGDEVRKGGEELGDGDNRNCCWWRSGPWDAKAEVEGEAHGRSGRGIRESVEQLLPAARYLVATRRNRRRSVWEKSCSGGTAPVTRPQGRVAAKSVAGGGEVE